MMTSNTPPNTTFSIKRRLTWSLGIAITLLWLLSGIGSALVSLHEINESEDSKMLHLAQTLLRVGDRLPENVQQLDNDNIESGFIVWQGDKVLLADEEGGQIPFQAASGFYNHPDIWHFKGRRVVYVHDTQSGYTVAVSQQFRERWEVLRNSFGVHLGLLLFSLPLLLWLLRRKVQQSLQPLDTLAEQLQQRSGHDLDPLSESVPVETQPLVQSFNRLLGRVQETMLRERQFSADAAHELRSPLAALKIQTEVLAMSQSEEERQHHIQQLLMSIERTSHLIDQLLVLSRLEPMQNLPEQAPLDWLDLARQTLSAVNFSAREKQIRLKLEDDVSGNIHSSLPETGSPMLVQLMLRNLLDNAIRYSPKNSTVTLYLMANQIQVCDEGQGIAPEHMTRIRDRFYRPAGQTQSGSGLGLSIVENIASLHGLQLTLANQDGGGLCASLSPTR